MTRSLQYCQMKEIILLTKISVGMQVFLLKYCSYVMRYLCHFLHLLHYMQKEILCFLLQYNMYL